MPNPFEQLSLEALRRRTSLKWRLYEPDVLPLWVAEMDLLPAPAVVRALTDALDLGDTGYPFGTGYAEAFADFAGWRWDWPIAADSMATVPDVLTGTAEVLKLLTGPGDVVVVNPPVYPPFYRLVESIGRRIGEARLTAGHRIDLVALDRAFGEARAGGRPAAYLLCSPHNPTGTVHSRTELQAVAELAAGHGVRVVADEIHAPLVYPDTPFVPYLSLPAAADAFVLSSASKAWNLAGLKAALAVAGPAAMPDLARLPPEVGYLVSHLGVIAHRAALTGGRDWLAETVSGLDQNRRLLARLLAAELPQVRYQPPAGGYLGWLDFRDLELAGDPAELILQRGRVALNSGPTFGGGGEGFARINLATSPAILTEAVRRIAAAVG
ncbi:aminotransferase class I/II-fold pyridoxal phosphate-dependent enzyme [Microlunatus panaciterrae]|uniref:cysteine-S-conjugate beta-lyase n=1 Tax=Microlunatus panaciterrae TaxID=400768 RepID=A0ABS2RQH3_9ACTN|nr:aminotransferase class I/II-fold pyridoxal phosphate-dependent enzyme [Microlunatus panaciterrae]MBM7800179.1 cystathionine beta-lyase [Microlunatus panaciterrae]